MAAEKSRVLLAILRYATARIIYGHSHDANSDAIKDFLLAIQARHDYIAQRFNHQLCPSEWYTLGYVIRALH
jgi:hypothetical protein